MPDEVRSREDLERLSKRGLCSWITLHSYKVAGHSHSKEELVDQACLIWDLLEASSDDHGAAANRSIAKKKQLNFGTEENKNPKTRSGLAGLTKTKLLQWMRSQGMSIPNVELRKVGEGLYLSAC